MRVITLRIPDEVHEKIKQRAAEKKTTMNIWLASAAQCSLNKDPEGLDDLIKSLGENAAKKIRMAAGFFHPQTSQEQPPC